MRWSRSVVAGAPLFDFTAPDGVRHEIWQVPAGDERRRSSTRSRKIDALYIADGHHRAASAARARRSLRARRPAGRARSRARGRVSRQPDAGACLTTASSAI